MMQDELLAAEQYQARLTAYLNDQSPRPFAKAAASLRKAHPVLLLAPDATIRAANQLAAWLWRSPREGNAVRREHAGAATLLGRNMLSVIQENLERVPLLDNRDFVVAQLALVELLTSEYKRVRRQASDLVAGLLEGFPALVSEYEAARPEPEQVFTFSLGIYPPSGSAAPLLHFRTTIDWTYDAAGPARGMLVQYHPSVDSATTAAQLKQANRELAREQPSLPSVVPEGLASRHEPLLLKSEPTGVSPLTRSVLEESPVTLFLDRSEESRQALALFRAAGQRFNPQPAPAGSSGPWIEFGDERYRGVEHVRQFVEALGRFDESFRASVERLMPGEEQPGSAALQRWLADQRRREFAAAEAIIEGRVQPH